MVCLPRCLFPNLQIPLRLVILLNNSNLINRSAGCDDLQPCVVKNAVSAIANLVNQSQSTGIFPDRLKTAKVVPVFKNEDERLVSNYRLIAVLPFFSKIFEKNLVWAIYKLF